MVLDEVPENAADALLPRRDDSRMWNRQSERVAEQRGDGEPVREPAHERGLGGRPDVAEPGVLAFERAGHDEHDTGEAEQPGGPPLHRIELRLAGRVVRARPGRRRPGRGRGGLGWRGRGGRRKSHQTKITPTWIRVIRHLACEAYVYGPFRAARRRTETSHGPRRALRRRCHRSAAR